MSRCAICPVCGGLNAWEMKDALRSMSCAATEKGAAYRSEFRVVGGVHVKGGLEGCMGRVDWKGACEGWTGGVDWKGGLEGWV